MSYDPRLDPYAPQQPQAQQPPPPQNQNWSSGGLSQLTSDPQAIRNAQGLSPQQQQNPQQQQDDGSIQRLLNQVGAGLTGAQQESNSGGGINIGSILGGIGGGMFG